MDYKTSFLIYKTQTINVNNIWKSKIRLIKNSTPLLKSINDSDIELIKNYRTELQNLTSTTKAQILNLKQSALPSLPSAQLSSIDDLILENKINFLNEKKLLDSEYKNDKVWDLESRIRLLILTYCTWSEASFIKLKHTPHGLSLAERTMNYGSKIEDKWRVLIDTILNKIPTAHNNDISIMRNDLIDIAQKYIIAPSILRNKIAHGQWVEAMNRDNNDINLDVSMDIANLDIVGIDTSFEIHNLFANILESILESNQPEDMVTERHDSYLFLKEKLDNLISSRSNWNTETRVHFLKQRNFDTRNLVLAQKMRSYNINNEIIKDITGVNN